jgi:hypothetical protein
MKVETTHGGSGDCCMLRVCYNGAKALSALHDASPIFELVVPNPCLLKKKPRAFSSQKEEKNSCLFISTTNSLIIFIEK